MKEVWVPYVEYTCNCPRVQKIEYDYTKILIDYIGGSTTTGICNKCHIKKDIKEIVYFSETPEKVVESYLMKLESVLMIIPNINEAQSKILKLFECSLQDILLKSLLPNEVEYWKNKFYIGGDFGYTVAQIGAFHNPQSPKDGEGFIYFSKICPRECTYDTVSMELNSRSLFEVLNELNLVKPNDQNSLFSMNSFQYFSGNDLALILGLSVNRYSHDGKLVHKNVDAIELDKKYLIYVDVKTFNNVADMYNLPKLTPMNSTLLPSLNLGDSELKKCDVFISHASEDKDEVARPLANALKQKGLRVWYDEFELKIGDSLRRKIDSGIANSRFGVVIISRNFFNKGWTNYEFDGLVARSVSGEQILLPIWHNVTKEEVIGFSSSLADKVARDTKTSSMDEIAEQILKVIKT